MTTLYVADDHSAMLHLWRRSNLRGLRLLRFDAHCDLRGLVIDQPRGLAAVRFDPRLLAGHVDGGNFLSHAVLEGRVQSIRWVHGPYGGRDQDVGTVAFCSDFPQGFLSRFRRAWLPIEFSSQKDAEDMPPLAAGEDLDVDFDFFASRLAPRASIERALDQFFQLSWPVAPERIYLARSPSYSHALPGAAEEFLVRLATAFSASVVRLPEPPHARRPGQLERLGYGVDKLLRTLQVSR